MNEIFIYIGSEKKTCICVKDFAFVTEIQSHGYTANIILNIIRNSIYHNVKNKELNYRVLYDSN